MINRFLKRTFDITSSLLVISVLCPIYILIAVLIKLDSKGPILFKQLRVGKDHINFKILKFRTMVVNAENIGEQITIGKRDPRVTNLGYLLRKFKLDELPQLFNVLAGNMSIVGPRPEVPKYVKLYNQEQKKVLTIKPGITDLASIEFSNENELLEKFENPNTTYIEVIMPKKLELNLQYIATQSFLTDLKIILKTINKIFIHPGNRL